MAKQKIKHQTADGKVHTRVTARTYSHVLVWTSPTGELSVTNWVGRADLVAAALAGTARYAAGAACKGVGTYHAEPLNHGARPGLITDQDKANLTKALGL